MPLRVIAWINDTELAHKFLELARILGIRVEIPRLLVSICQDSNSLVVTDDVEIAAEMDKNRKCRVVLLRARDTLSNLITAVSEFIGTPSEIVVGVDLGKEKLAYVVIVAGIVIDYGICINCIKEFAKRICRLKNHKIFVGIGYTMSVSDNALRLYELLRECGINVSIVDERKSNKTILMGLRGSEMLRKTDLRAAAIVALRSRSGKYAPISLISRRVDERCQRP